MAQTVKLITDEQPAGKIIGSITAYDGGDGWLMATQRSTGVAGCTCHVRGNGTLPQPLFVAFCPMHAAAPEMYEALRRVVSLSNNLGDDDQNHTNLAVLNAEARAALKLAEGETK